MPDLSTMDPSAGSEDVNSSDDDSDHTSCTCIYCMSASEITANESDEDFCGCDECFDNNCSCGKCQCDVCCFCARRLLVPPEKPTDQYLKGEQPLPPGKEAIDKILQTQLQESLRMWALEITKTHRLCSKPADNIICTFDKLERDTELKQVLVTMEAFYVDCSWLQSWGRNRLLWGKSEDHALRKATRVHDEARLRAFAVKLGEPYDGEYERSKLYLEHWDKIFAVVWGKAKFIARALEAGGSSLI